MGIILRGVVLGLSITAPIGPTNVEVIRRGVKEGWRSAFVFCLGVMVALLLWTGIMGADLAASRSSLGEGLSLGLGILIGVFLLFVCLTALIHYGRRFLQQRYVRYVSLIAGAVLLYFCVRFAYSLLRAFV
jgi:threonine/homoserine/homoserine lactone efflux protein